MKAGISYNVFNAEEHLLASLRQVRPHVEHINLIVQFVSYSNNPCSEGLRHVIHAAKSQGLCDDVIEFRPDFGKSGKLNELAKRSMGLDVAQRNYCTHFMTMDCDEYYVADEFARARAAIIENGIQASAVSTFLHIKRPIWRSKEPDTTYCSFLTEITDRSRLELNSEYPVGVDPKRRLHGDSSRFHLFYKNEISMRHMNLVRHDFEAKLANSSNASKSEFMQQVREEYARWRFGEVLRFPRKPPMEIIKVEDIFKIDHLFKDAAESFPT